MPWSDIVFFFTALSHGYPVIVYNKKDYTAVKQWTLIAYRNLNKAWDNILKSGVENLVFCFSKKVKNVRFHMREHVYGITSKTIKFCTDSVKKYISTKAFSLRV